MRKSPPSLILWVLIVCLTCISPVSVSAGVGDNIAGASLELSVGQPETSDEPATLFGWFRKVWTQLSKLDSMSTKIDSMSDKLDSMKLDVGISASQTYLTMLNDYQTNGTSSSVYNDKSQWDALCRSSVMHCSQKFSGEALDYYITNNISLEQFFKDMNYADATIYTIDDIVANYSTIRNNSLCMYSLCNSKEIITYDYLNSTSYALSSSNYSYLRNSRFYVSEGIRLSYGSRSISFSGKGYVMGYACGYGGTFYIEPLYVVVSSATGCTSWNPGQNGSWEYLNLTFL